MWRSRALLFAGYLILFTVIGRSASAVSYYVDSQMGDDLHTGLSTEKPWKTLKPINEKMFRPDDRILLRSGGRFTGGLILNGSGTADHPIELASYGLGPDPRIDGEGASLDAILLKNVGHWLIHNLEITNRGSTTAPFRTGIHLQCNDGSCMEGVHLSYLHVHDVNGDLRKEQEGCGIFFDTLAGESHFDHLLIENCHIAHVDRNGLCQRSQAHARSTRVVIRGNLLEDIGGDAIKLWGTDGGIIEHNTVRGGRTRCDDYAAGIWPFSCDHTIIQFNEVSGMKGIKDGQAFDSDYICKNSIFQYNYSHDNEGGFMLLCSPGSSYCQDTIVRYNISQGDGRNDSAVFHFAGNVTDSLVYNNIVYVGFNQNVPLLAFSDWSSYSHHNSFFNNIFYVDGMVSYKWGKSTENIFDFNTYFGSHVSRPKDDHANLIKPLLEHVGSGGQGIASLVGYRWIAGHSIPRGRLIPQNGGRDFFGDLVPGNIPPCVGAYQRD